MQKFPRIRNLLIKLKNAIKSRKSTKDAKKMIKEWLNGNKELNDTNNDSMSNSLSEPIIQCKDANNAWKEKHFDKRKPQILVSEFYEKVFVILFITLLSLSRFVFFYIIIFYI